MLVVGLYLLVTVKARKLAKMVLEIQRRRAQSTVWFRLSINDFLWTSGVSGVLGGLKIRRFSFDSRLVHIYKLL